MAFNTNQRLNGLNPLAYIGDNAVQPPDFVTKARPPTSVDSKNFALGDIWLDTTGYPSTLPTASNIWMLVALVGNQATWVTFGAGSLQRLTGNSGGPVSPDGAFNINVIGDGTYIDIVGNPGINTLTASLINGGNYASSFITNPATAVATPVLGVLTFAGAGGTVITAAGSTVTIAGGGGIGTWVDVTGAAQAIAANTGYTANRATLITFTLPAIIAYGTVFEIVGKGIGLWRIAQNAGQTVHFGKINTTVGAGGSITSTLQYDTISILCSVANTEFTVRSCFGDLTYV